MPYKMFSRGLQKTFAHNACNLIKKFASVNWEILFSSSTCEWVRMWAKITILFFVLPEKLLRILISKLFYYKFKFFILLCANGIKITQKQVC